MRLFVAIILALFVVGLFCLPYYFRFMRKRYGYLNDAVKQRLMQNFRIIEICTYVVFVLLIIAFGFLLVASN